jgi:hypothetical protein
MTAFSQHLTDDDLEEVQSQNIQMLTKLVHSKFTDLDESEHAALLGGFVTGIRETYEGEVEVEDIQFDDKVSGSLSISFCTAVHMGCRDIDGRSSSNEKVNFYIDAEQRTICFETIPPPPQNERVDEI